MRDTEPLYSNVGQKKAVSRKLIVREIVGNLKMIGLAICLFAVYMLIFVAVRQKDIRECDYTTNQALHGESRYDSLIGYFIGSSFPSWQEEYAKELRELDFLRTHPDVAYFEECNARHYIPQDKPNSDRYYNGFQERLIQRRTILTSHKLLPSEYLQEALALEAKLQLSQEEINSYEALAHRRTDSELKRWAEYVNESRMMLYEMELKEHAKYAAILSLLICIIGRYLYLLVKRAIRKK